MNAEQIIAQIRLRVPAQVFPAGWSWYDQLNLAGINFCNHYPWTWTQAKEAVIVGTVGSELIRLPDDFVGVISCRAEDLGRDTVRVVSSDWLSRERNRNVLGSAYLYFVSFDGSVDQATPAEYAGQFAQIWPAPVSDGSPRLKLVYRRGWRHIPEGASGHKPNIDHNALPVFLDFFEAQVHETLFETPVRHAERKAERLAALIATDEARTLPTPIEPGMQRDEGDETPTFRNDLVS